MRYLLLLFLLIIPVRVFSADYTVQHREGRVLFERSGVLYEPRNRERVEEGAIVRTYASSGIVLRKQDYFYSIHPSSRVELHAEPLLSFGKVSASPTGDFINVRFYVSPHPAQGTTMEVVVRPGEKCSVRSRLIDPFGNTREIKMYPLEGVKYRALAGFDVEARPDRYRLHIDIYRDNGGWTHIVHPLYLKKTSFETGRVNLNVKTGKLLEPSEEKKREREELWEILTRPSDAQFWDGAFMTPLPDPVIVSGFGRQRAYYIDGDFAFVRHHRGVDYRAGKGQVVVAPGRGTVAFSGKRITTGNTVVLDHGQGVFSLFFHLDSMEVRAGESVKRGELIGGAGNTGISAGVHLHWSVVVNGVYVDPEDWLRYSF